MPFRPAPNVVQLVAKYTSWNEIVENVYHFSSGAAPTTATMNNLIDAFVNIENTNLKALRATQTVLTEVSCADLSSATGAFVDRAVNPTIAGTNAGLGCPNNVTIAVAWRTAKRGRSYRGRTFHIGFTETMRTGNTITSGALAAFIAAYSNLLVLGAAPIFNLGVLSGRQGGVDINPRIFTPATACTIDVNLDNQRRRLPGHNRHH